MRIADIIELENDKHYIVANVTNYQGKDYYLLVDENNIFDTAIAYQENMKLILINNEEEYNTILTKFDPRKVLDILQS